MKRAAEAQLTRDTADTEQDDQEEFRPFQQADEAILAGRKIRSLPRRRGLGSHSTSGSPSPVSAPYPQIGLLGYTEENLEAFMGTHSRTSTQAPSGFGLKQSTPPSMTDNPASTTAPVTSAATFTFGKLPSAGLTSNFSFKLPSSNSPLPTTPSMISQPSTPASSNSALDHKPRASFSQPSTSSPLKTEITASPSGAPSSIFGNSHSSNVPVSATKPKPTFTFPASGLNATVNGTTSTFSEIQASQAEVDYWKNLRGLNLSFLATAQNLYQKDAFIDLSELFAGYCKIRNEMNEKRPTAPTVNASTKGGYSFAGKSISLGSLAPPTSTTTSGTGIGGFPALPTGFSFGGKTASFTSDSGSSAAAAGSSQNTSVDIDELENDKDDEKMGKEVKGPESQQTSLSKFGSGFSFGALPGVKPISSFGMFGASSGNSDFKGFGTTPSTTTAAAKQPFSSDLPPSGMIKPPETNEHPTSTAPKHLFGFGLPPSSTTAPTGESKSTFGSSFPPSQTPNAPMSILDPTPDEKKPAGVDGFSFGNLSSWPSAQGASGSNVGSSGPKPVGLSGSSLFSGVAGFGFGAVPPTPAGGTPGTETPTMQPGGGEDHVPSAEQRYDVEGPGEEDEETVGGASWRAKVWQLGKARGEDGKEKEGAGVEWVDFGVSFVRLKKHKTTGTKRILARHSKTGHIVMNFAFFPQLSPKVSDKVISFVGVANGKPASFRMRLQTAEQAAQLLTTWKELIDMA